MSAEAATFTLDESDALLEFFDEQGYVAVRGVLSEEECLETHEEMNALMRRANPAFDLGDPDTWDQAPINPRYGVFGGLPVFSRRFLLNRQHPNIHRAFSLLAGTPDLLVNHDRFAFYRPTRQVPFSAGPADRPGWRTEYDHPAVHLDFNPAVYRSPEVVVAAREALRYEDGRDWLSENNLYCDGDGRQLQAVLNLEDNREEDGGFQCVPSFHRRFEEWLAGHASDDRSPAGLYRFSARSANDNAFVTSPMRVPCPAGSLIVWDQRLAHGTRPNDSSRWRLIQFLKAFPRSIVSRERYEARRRALTRVLKEVGFADELTEVGRTVFGLRPSGGA